MHDKVFAYIVQSQHNETLECHAFLCPKRKTVSQLCVFLSIFFLKKTQNNHIAKDKEKSGRENRKGGDGGIPLQHSLHLWGLNNEPLPPLPSPRQFCSGQNGPVTSGHVNKFPSPLDGTLRGNLFAGSQSLPVKTGSDGSCRRLCDLISLSVSQQAQAVTLTVAQAFRVAFEFWQAAKEGMHGHAEG